MQYTLAEPALARVQAKLSKLAKIADKLGLSAPTLTEVGQEYRTIDGQDYRYVVIEVAGTAPCLAGWSFVAILEHREDGNLLKCVPDSDPLPTSYRTNEPLCDHCKLNRQRKDTYLVRHMETGEYRQVGRQCLRDFLGHENPETIAQYAEMLADLAETCTDTEGMIGVHGTPQYRIAEVLAWTASATEKDGYVSRKTAEEQGTRATVDTIRYLMIPPPRAYRSSTYERDLTKYQPDTRQIDFATAALTWCHDLPIEQTVGSDYLWNIRLLAQQDHVISRNFGLACSIIQAYRRQQEQEAERRQAQFISTHVGTVGKRQVFTGLTVISLREIVSQFGVKIFYNFADPTGNRLICWHSGQDRLDQGQTYTLKASVKEHGEFRGVKQTTLARIARI